MKKSKIIVPALGLLLLSTAASVSGTVAWFTAQRTYELNAGNFAVVNTKDNLTCLLGAGVGTSANNAGKAITLANNDYKLTDASFDHVNEKFVEPDGEGTNIAKIIALNDGSLGTKLVRETNVYTAFTWTMDFSLAFGGVSRTSYLYFNVNASWVKKSDDTAISGTTGEGFRIAFIPTAAPATFSTEKAYAVGDLVTYNAATYECTTAHAAGAWNAEHFKTVTMGTGSKLVWAAHRQNVTASAGAALANGASGADGKSYYTRAASDANHAGYLGDGSYLYTLAGNGTGFTADAADTYYLVEDANKGSSLHYINTSGVSVTDDVPTATTTLVSKETKYSANALDSTSTLAVPNPALGTEDNKLGLFTYAANTVSHLKYTVVVWFEGTDQKIINTPETVYDTVKTHLEFGVSNANA